MSYEAIDNTVDLIKETDEFELDRFPADFVSKYTGAISRCLDDGSRPFSIRSGERYNVLFDEPAYIDEIEIFFSKSIFGVPIEISLYDSLSNRDSSFKAQFDEINKKAIILPKRVSTGFSIYLHPGLFEAFKRKTLDVEKIIVYGYFASDFEAMSKEFRVIESHKENAISFILKEKERIAKKEDDLNQKEIKILDLEESKKEEIEQLNADIKNCEENYNSWKKDLNDLQKEINASESKRNQLTEQINHNETTKRNIDGEITSGKAQLEIIARKTKEAEEKLKELTSNVNLFSEEFASFSNHGAKQTNIFIGLSLIPLAIIAFLSYQLLSGAVDLSIKYSQDPNIDLLTIFVTRIPYILVCGSILTVCYSLTKFLFNRISYIYAEKLDFSKISIIAKDVATASSNNTALPDEHLYESRTYLKIEMLKSYLSGNIGQFSYTQRSLAKLIEEDSSTNRNINEKKSSEKTNNTNQSDDEAEDANDNEG